MSPMMNFGKHLHRRTVLRGLGAAVALPLLDGMVPAFAAMRTTAAQPVRRLGAIYLPNGANMGAWTPAAEGAGFELPRSLQPLAPFRDQLLVLTGMDNREAEGRAGEGLGDHSRVQAAYLTGVHVKKTEGPDIQNGISMDQIVAREAGKETQLASLELALESNDVAGGCEDGYSCAYTGTIAWRSPSTPLPMENDPRAAFERLFGAGLSTDVRARKERLARDRSLLDVVMADLARLQPSLGPKDRVKMAEYLDSIRDVERRIQMTEAQSDRELPVVQRPRGVPATFEEHARLMFDLMALAYQSDLTRVVTLMVGREKTGRTYPEIGVPDPHHAVSHHGGRPDRLEQQAKINTFHNQLFAHLLETLRATADGDGTLLDHAMILYGSGMSNSNLHVPHNLPMLLVGGGAGQLKGGRHLRFAPGTPLTNLHLTVLDKMGVPTERLGDSTGRLDLLSGV